MFATLTLFEHDRLQYFAVECLLLKADAHSLRLQIKDPTV